MNYRSFFIYFLVCTCLLSCKEIQKDTNLVLDMAELNEAIKNAKPGDEIVLKNGVWKDVEIKFRGDGSKEMPIVLRAETPGKVSIEGKSYLKFGGSYLVVDGLYFKNGYSPSNAVIDFKISSKDS